MKGRRGKARSIGSLRKAVRVREIKIDRIGKTGEEIEIFNINQNKKTEIETEIASVVKEIKRRISNVKNKERRSSLRNLVGIRIKVMLRRKRQVRNLSMILLIVLRILLILLVHSNLMIESVSMRRKEAIQKAKINAERTKRRIKFVIRERRRKKIRTKIEKRISIRQRR
jgi:hypothetical protein